MKITKTQLRRIIKEELSRALLKEQRFLQGKNAPQIGTELAKELTEPRQTRGERGDAADIYVNAVCRLIASKEPTKGRVEDDDRAYNDSAYKHRKLMLFRFGNALIGKLNASLQAGTVDVSNLPGDVVDYVQAMLTGDRPSVGVVLVQNNTVERIADDIAELIGRFTGGMDASQATELSDKMTTAVENPNASAANINR
jgi:hypothetical protein